MKLKTKINKLLSKFSLAERNIIWILLNTDEKLSYDDLAIMLHKKTSTIQSQVSSIRKKDNDLIRTSKNELYLSDMNLGKLKDGENFG
ncbi:MAG: hypothetical protein KKF56_00060 [Nanoarchaeota archaeon]|nr:hypothetical protein [Nanoarchaeota archaeon]